MVNDRKTLGERWHEEVEDESMAFQFAVFFAAMALILTLVVMLYPEQSEAAQFELQAASYPTAKSLDKKIAFSNYKTKQAKAELKLYNNYKDRFTKAQRKQYLKDIGLILSAEKKAEVKFQRSKASTARAYMIKYVTWKTNMTASQQSAYNRDILNVFKAKTSSKISKHKASMENLLDRAELCEYIDATGYSDAKVDNVSEWGRRIDNYLYGTPMERTGYIIAHAAWDYDMDPRIYPAIADIESKCGECPYGNQYNVCGWTWNPPEMYGWEDAAVKWHDYFQSYFGDETYPIQSMHGYCGYSPSLVNERMAMI